MRRSYLELLQQELEAGILGYFFAFRRKVVSEMVRLMLNVLLKNLQTSLNYFLHFLGLTLSLFGGSLGLRIRRNQHIPEVAEEDVKSISV